MVVLQKIWIDRIFLWLTNFSDSNPKERINKISLSCQACAYMRLKPLSCVLRRYAKPAHDSLRIAVSVIDAGSHRKISSLAIFSIWPKRNRIHTDGWNVGGNLRPKRPQFHILDRVLQAVWKYWKYNLYLASFFGNLWSCSIMLFRYFFCTGDTSSWNKFKRRALLNSHSIERMPSNLSSSIATGSAGFLSTLITLGCWLCLALRNFLKNLLAAWWSLFARLHKVSSYCHYCLQHDPNTSTFPWP